MEVESVIEVRPVEIGHPLLTTLDRVGELNAYVKVRLGRPEGTGWWRVEELVESGAPHLGQLLARVAAGSGTDRRDVAASFFFHRYGWLMASLGIGAYRTDGRVPDLAITNVAVHFDDAGFADGVALRGGRFLALPDDPARDHPDATIVADAAALRDELRRSLERHMAPVIEAVRARAPLGKRAMWLSLADNCAWCLLEYGTAPTDPGGRAAEVVAFTQAPGSPLRGRTRVLEVGRDGRRRSFIARASCCLNYKLPGEEHCDTCPLLPADVRDDRLRAAMAAES